MNFTVTIHLSTGYYSMAYTEAINSKPWRKYEKVFSMAIIAIGLVLLAVNWFALSSAVYLSMLAVATGCWGLFYSFYARRKWMNDRTKSNLLNKAVQLTFTDTGISVVGPFSSGQMLWAGIQSIRQTGNGLILKPENGTMIYIPKQAFLSQEQIQSIIGMVHK